ncbi:hypothetical protein WJX77_012362 [Trebouxia sp. C0004]
MEQLGTNAATRITEALEIDQRHCTHPAKISTTSGKASGGACSTGSFQSNLCQLVQSHLQAVLQARWLSASARRVMELLQCQKDNTLLLQMAPTSVLMGSQQPSQPKPAQWGILTPNWWYVARQATMKARPSPG